MTAVKRGQSGPGIRSFDHVSLPMRNTDAMLSFYRALGLTVNEGPQICSVHLGDQKLNLHRPEFWQDAGFTTRAPAAEPPCGDFCVVWEGGADALTMLFERVGAEGHLEAVGVAVVVGIVVVLVGAEVPFLGDAQAEASLASAGTSAIRTAICSSS